MNRWYDTDGKMQDIIVGSRIRLRRNIKNTLFPQAMEATERKKLSQKMAEVVCESAKQCEVSLELFNMSGCKPIFRKTLLERSVLGKSALTCPDEAVLALSEDEQLSVLLNCDDHIQLQVNEAGLGLKEALARANWLDDRINETFPYAFDEKYGYMTCFPTNLGTGMRAYLILHLPVLASSQRFRTTATELGRYGVAIRDALVCEDKNPSGLYVIYNQKTLGLTEEEIVNVLTKIGVQLAGSEKRLRALRSQKNGILYEDEIYRAYAALKYARVMKYDEALINLSRLRMAVSAERLTFQTKCNLYALMLEVAPNHLKVYYQKENAEEEVDVLRANFLRERLPMLVKE